MVDLPAPVGPTIASLPAGGDGEVDALQDLAVGPVAEMHVLEPHRAGGALRQMRGQRARVGAVRDLPLDTQQAEHLLHVDQALLDLAIDEAEEIQRLVELHQVGVDQHEVADRHAA